MSKHKHHDKVQQALALLEGTKAGIGALLSDPELATLKARVLNILNKAGNPIQMITGGAIMNSNNTLTNDVSNIMASLQPMETVGGEYIGRTMPLVPTDLDVPVDERQQFIANRDALASRFDEMSNEDVYLFMKQPQGASLVRSLAKQAGHPQWREGVIDDQFLESVHEKIRFNASLLETVNGAEEIGTNRINPDGDADEFEEDDDLEQTAATGITTAIETVKTDAPDYTALVKQTQSQDTPPAADLNQQKTTPPATTTPPAAPIDLSKAGATGKKTGAPKPTQGETEGK